MKTLSREKKAALDIALERGISNPNDLKGSFAWASLIPLLPLLTPIIKPVEKLIDRGSEKLLEKIGLPDPKKGKGFTPTGSNDIRLSNPIAPVYVRPTPTPKLGSGAAGTSIADEQLEVLKKKLMPYTSSPDAFKAKLMQLIKKAESVKKA